MITNIEPPDEFDNIDEYEWCVQDGSAYGNFQSPTNVTGDCSGMTGK